MFAECCCDGISTVHVQSPDTNGTAATEWTYSVGYNGVDYQLKVVFPYVIRRNFTEMH
jgi:hypothetical protein